MPVGLSKSDLKKNTFVVKKWEYDPEVLNLKDGACLEGFFQTDKYFKDIEQLIRKDLEIGDDFLDEEAGLYLREILDSNSIAVHVRRGDYLKLKWLNVCNSAYYANAFSFMQEQLNFPRFFVFSDEIEWCAKHLDFAECTFVDISASRKNPIIDLKLMSLCRHAIIANSSFSWWAAWLNSNPSKVIAAPKQWFSEESGHPKDICRDTVPRSWKRIDF